MGSPLASTRPALNMLSTKVVRAKAARPSGAGSAMLAAAGSAGGAAAGGGWLLARAASMSSAMVASLQDVCLWGHSLRRGGGARGSFPLFTGRRGQRLLFRPRPSRAYRLGWGFPRGHTPLGEEEDRADGQAGPQGRDQAQARERDPPATPGRPRPTHGGHQQQRQGLPEQERDGVARAR